MGRTVREHQEVIRNFPAVHIHNVSLAIDAGDLAEQDTGIVLPPEQTPDRPSDLRRGQTRCGYLVEQRLKEVVVLAVDQSDLDGCLGEPFRGGQAAEPGANNDHVRPAAHAAARHQPQPGRIRRLI